MSAHWNDKDGSKRQKAIAGEGEKLKSLKATYAGEADALEAAHQSVSASERQRVSASARQRVSASSAAQPSSSQP